MPTGADAAVADVDRKLAGGALTNFIGILAKTLHPVFLIVVTRLYGTETTGLYTLAFYCFELLAAMTSAGWRDVTLLVGGRHAERDDPEHRKALIAGLGQTFQAVILGSLVVSGLTVLIGGPILRWVYPEDDVWMPLLWFMPAMLALGLAEVAIGATKSLLIMKYDAFILGFLRPAAMVITAAAMWPVWPTAEGLGFAFTLAHVVVLGAALWVFARHFPLRPIVVATLRERPDRELWGFAIPQSLNMSLNSASNGLDTLILAHFGVSLTGVAFYSTASRIIRNVRQVKLGFSSALNPLISRLHADRNVDELEHRFATVARWIGLFTYPALILVLAFRDELLWLFDESYADHNAFMLLLAVPPLLSCALGLAGNVVVMAGFSRWNLANSIAYIATIGISGWLLIPPFGYVGAGWAAAIGSLVVSIAQVIEMRVLVGVRLRWREFGAPHLAGALAGVIATVVWFAIDAFVPEAVTHAASAVAGLLGYALVLRMLGLPPEDRALLRRKSRS